MTRDQFKALMTHRREAGDLGNEVVLGSKDFEELLDHHTTMVHQEKVHARERGSFETLSCNGVTVVFLVHGS